MTMTLLLPDGAKENCFLPRTKYAPAHMDEDTGLSTLARHPDTSIVLLSNRALWEDRKRRKSTNSSKERLTLTTQSSPATQIKCILMQQLRLLHVNAAEVSIPAHASCTSQKDHFLDRAQNNDPVHTANWLNKIQLYLCSQRVLIY